MTEHWLGSRVIMVHRSGTDFEHHLLRTIYDGDADTIEIAGVTLRCDDMFSAPFDAELVLTHLSPFDEPPSNSSTAGLLRRRGLGRKGLLRAALGGRDR